MTTSSHENGHYVVWRKSRINKLDQIFGKQYFEGKRVLEVGAGYGLIGKFLHEEWDADVSFTEGRETLVEKIKEFNPDAAVYMINHEEPWDLGRKFDFIIHWGLLYHLNNWRDDLIYTNAHLAPGGILSLETEIFDFEGDNEFKSPEPREQDDQAIGGIGTQPTELAVENMLRRLERSFKRYDDTDLNAEFHHYDWIAANTRKCRDGQRRFWIAK